MRGLFYIATQEMEMRETIEAVPDDDQLLVDVDHCGICGSDMHAWHGHDERRVPPLILGHEAVGVVRDGDLTGKRVAINPLMTCGNCDRCASGAEHLCADRELIGMRLAGAFAQSVAVKKENVHVLSDHLGFQDAALAEPLACAVHAVRLGERLGSTPPDKLKVLVLGGGAIGLLGAFLYQLDNVSELWVAEMNQPRARILAKVLDAKIYNPVETGPPHGYFNVVLDAVGSGVTRRASTGLVAPGGVVVHIGLQDSGQGLDTRYITLQEIIFAGTYCYTNAHFSQALGMLERGDINGKGWTQIRGLDEGGQAFWDIHNGTAPPKIILSP